MSFVFGDVSLPVCLIEHTPFRWWQLHGMFEALKNDKSIFGSVSMPSEGR